jgi:hypothetical protein
VIARALCVVVVLGLNRLNVSRVRCVRIVDVIRLLQASEFDTPAAVGGERSLQSITSECVVRTKPPGGGRYA